MKTGYCFCTATGKYELLPDKSSKTTSLHKFKHCTGLFDITFTPHPLDTHPGLS
jgi:hypothetical protein